MSYSSSGNFKKIYLSTIVTIAFLFIHSFLFSQNYTVSGKVIDSQNREPLAFVNILINKDIHVTQSDIDGFFNISFPAKIDSLHLSYVGYENHTYKVNAKTKNIVIELKRKQIQLNEVVVFPGENPAHRIIRKMIENKDKNNPEKLGSFSYTSYNKMIFSAKLDSVKNDTAKVDSDLVKAKSFFDKQYLFLMESVTERKFMYPDRNSEKLIASKVSGFKDPLFALLVTQMQSFSFYKDLIKIGDKNYIAPVTKSSIDKYFFLIEDTLYQGNDTVYVISYKPHKNRNFDGLKGLLYINTNGYAIQNVIAEPATEEEGGMDIKIQQKYELIDNKQWFPVQLNSDFIFKNVTVNRVKLSGEGHSYLKDIVLNPEFKKSDFTNVDLEVKDANTDPDSKIWNKYRTDSLTEKDKRTYHVIDSLGKAEHLDKTMRSFETIMSQKIPYKFLDFDIGRFVNFNDHEGWRFGLGVHNNYHLSNRFTAGGYVSYGLRDKVFKYGADASVKFLDKYDVSFGVKYINDVAESGGIEFYEQNNTLFSDAAFRKYMIIRMDKIEKEQVFLKFTAFKYLKANISLSQVNKIATNDYQYGLSNNNVSVLFNNFYFTELGAYLCYSYKEKYIQALRYKISEGTKYPIVWFNYIRGFNNLFVGAYGNNHYLLDGEYAYNRYEFKIKKSFFIKSLGTTSLQFQAGYIDGDLPYCNLFNGIGSYRQFTIAAPNSFGTMRMNEFLSNRYAAFFFTHSFGKLLFRFKKFSPEPAVCTNVCIGDLNNPEKHFNVPINTLRKGYIESGLLLNSILNTGAYGIGVGAFYRYGYYSLPSFSNNMAYKFILTFYM
jgi:hypothetical protein